MSFIRKYRKGDRTYLAEVESKRIDGKVVQRFNRTDAGGRLNQSITCSVHDAGARWERLTG